ncbi:probable protein phosphatase 2C 4 [Arachis stenosperma]|uniref:probable protein phosphatase 2C 4 n=1 Tax=Arachis stenosperma TaxID=217475 RepID=UPI0025AD27A6|nr:probable protein phosphatase 2C 4 [Arachis stenosperma]XP_057757600.1 probable protein phosphatase 2C 4 [Arachis stenosperma]
MGNRMGKLCVCSSDTAGEISGRFDNGITFLSDSHDKALGDSIYYVRPDNSHFSRGSSGNVFSDGSATFVTFRSVSGATVSANTSSTPSTSLDDSLQQETALDSSASFESSGSFASTTMTTSIMVPLQPQQHSPADGFFIHTFPKSPLNNRVLNGQLGDEKAYGYEHANNKTCGRSLKKLLSGSFLPKEKRPIFKNNGNANARVGCSTNLSDEPKFHNVVVVDDDDDDDDDKCNLSKGCQNLHWAHGRAGEDRLHIVICEDDGWIYVGIYDGFNGPDATDYLLNNLFYAVYEELKKILGCQDSKSLVDGGSYSSSSFNKENNPIGNGNLKVERRNSRNCKKEVKLNIENMVEAKMILENAKLSEWDVLQGLSKALRVTEAAFLKSSDEMIAQNPVLAMMGSCVLVMLMKGEDVYLMNVGDSRAVLATHNGNSLQLTMEHSTHVKEEVRRIWREHPDDPSAVTKGRVKGYLNVTRAFGAGFLKQPKQNNAVLETFKVNYIGDSPYITCCPSLHHHRLGPNDKFLLLSSDGIFQYFTNEEAIFKVDYFITMFPDIDPAQLLIEETLHRAAKNAGMNFHELLDIPQGERRLYHDDISIVIISLEGKIWRSTV